MTVLTVTKYSNHAVDSSKARRTYLDVGDPQASMPSTDRKSMDYWGEELIYGARRRVFMSSAEAVSELLFKLKSTCLSTAFSRTAANPLMGLSLSL